MLIWKLPICRTKNTNTNTIRKYWKTIMRKTIKRRKIQHHYKTTLQSKNQYMLKMAHTVLYHELYLKSTHTKLAFIKSVYAISNTEI